MEKRKIHWGRIIAALVIFILIIMGIVQAVKGVVNHFARKETTDVATSHTDSSSGNDIKREFQFKVCIDAGHGDFDCGTTSLDGQRLEKDDNLALALKVRDELVRSGAVVVMTRDDDSFLDPGERCKSANESSADLFVSLHRNSYDGNINGIEVWVHNKKPEKDTTLAQCILDELDKTEISDNRGIQYGYVGQPWSNYYINADTKMPSCLLEMGFLTSDKDNDLLDENMDSYAKAISDGIINAAKELGVIDNDGKRILNEQLVTKEKEYSSSESDNDSLESDDTSRLVYNDGEQEIYTE